MIQPDQQHHEELALLPQLAALVAPFAMLALAKLRQARKRKKGK